MDPVRNSEELLRELLSYEKKQLRHTRLATFVNILLVLAVVAALTLLVPRALHSLAEVDRLAVSAQELIDNASTMVADNTDAITETIRDLNDAIKPLAELARKLG
jgi:predicted nucleic acid-binding Zn ribbon protein